MKPATIMRLSGLGDIYCAASIANQLKIQHGYTHIRLLCKPGYEFLGEHLPIFNSICLCENEKDTQFPHKYGKDLSKIVGKFYHPRYKYVPIHIMNQMAQECDCWSDLKYQGFDFSDLSFPKNRIVINNQTGKYFSGVKKYPYWSQIVEQLQDKYGEAVILVGEENKQYTFIEQCGIVTSAKLFLGPVSFFSHIAGHYDITSVIINAGLEHNNLAIYPSQKVINSGVACSPCYLRECNQVEKYKCQHEIKPDDVLKYC